MTEQVDVLANLLAAYVPPLSSDVVTEMLVVAIAVPTCDRHQECCLPDHIQRVDGVELGGRRGSAIRAIQQNGHKCQIHM